MKNRGFSLIEIVIYATIIGMIVSLFSGIMVSLARIKGKNIASTEVNQQLTYALQTIERIIKGATAIELEPNIPLSLLTVNAADPSENPTIISLAAGKITLQKGNAAPIN